MARRSKKVAEGVGENLRRIRTREDLSQERLAVRASLHRTEIEKLEAGLRIPRADTAVQLAGALGVPPGELLEGIEPDPPIRPLPDGEVGQVRLPVGCGDGSER